MTPTQASEGSGFRTGWNRVDAVAVAVLACMRSDYKIQNYALMKGVAEAIQGDPMVITKRWLGIADSGNVMAFDSALGLQGFLREYPGLTWIVDIKKALDIVDS